MDFHSLLRKDLQALCKRNKIPANMTNVAMADALCALQTVEGLDDLMNQSQSSPPQSPAKLTTGSLVKSRTATRASTRRKPVKEEPQSLQPTTRTRRVTRRAITEEMDQENVNMLETPTTRTSQSKARSALAQQQSETHVIEDEEKEKIAGQGQNNLLQTPAAHTSRPRATAASSRRKGTDSQLRVYSTRRSVRLLEKTMVELSIKEKEETNIAEIDKDMMEEESSDVSGPLRNVDGNLKNSEQTNESEASSGKILTQPLENEMDFNENNNDTGVHDANKKTSSNVDDYPVLDVNDETRNNKTDNPDACAHVIEDLVDGVADLDGAFAGCVDAAVTELSSELNSVCDAPTNGKELDAIEKIVLEDIDLKVSDNVADVVPPEELNVIGCDDAPVAEFSSELNSVCGASRNGEELNTTENIVLEDSCLEISDHIADAVPQEESNATPIVNADHIGGELPAVLNRSTLLTADEDTVGSPDSKCRQLQIEEMSSEDFQSGFDSEKSMAHQLDLVEPSGEINTVDGSVGMMEVYNTEQNDSPSKMEGNPSTVLLSDNDLDESSDRQFQQLQREEMSVEDIQSALNSEKLMAHQLDPVESSEKISIIDNSLGIMESSDRKFQQLQREEMSVEDIQSALNSEKLMAHQLDPVESSEKISIIDNSLGVMEMCNTEQNCARQTGGDADVETSVGRCVMSGEESTLRTYEVLSALPDPTEKKLTIGFPVSPFASDSVSGQFPRPTLSTPMKSSSKKQTTMQKLTYVADKNNKENIDKSERENDKVKKVKNIIDADSLKDVSLRQLSKMVKELEISKNRKKSEVEEGKGRVALQKLTENRMHVAEPEKN